MVNVFTFITSKKTSDLKTWVSFIIPSILDFLIILIIIEKDNPKQGTTLFMVSFLIILAISIYYLVNINKFVKHKAGLIPAFLFPMGVVFTLLRLYTSKTQKQATTSVIWFVVYFLLFSGYLLSNLGDNLFNSFMFLLPAILSLLIIGKLYRVKKNELVFQEDNYIYV